MVLSPAFTVFVATAHTVVPGSVSVGSSPAFTTFSALAVRATAEMLDLIGPLLSALENPRRVSALVEFGRMSKLVNPMGQSTIVGPTRVSVLVNPRRMSALEAE